jgi:hypothetical protein
MPTDHELEMQQIERETKLQQLEIAKQQNADYREKKAAKEQLMRTRVEMSEQENAEKERRQNICRHKTGGEGKDGWLRGDGSKGYSVTHQVLPTGEYYMFCNRCGKEWHHPMWQVKFEILATNMTSMTRTQYNRKVAEYDEVFGWDHAYTKVMEASRFTIPKLEAIKMDKVKFAPEAVAV